MAINRSNLLGDTRAILGAPALLSSASAQAPGGSIKVGVTGPFSGRFALHGKSLKAVIDA
jgi:hypothetical protein